MRIEPPGSRQCRGTYIFNESHRDGPGVIDVLPWRKAEGDARRIWFQKSDLRLLTSRLLRDKLAPLLPRSVLRSLLVSNLRPVSRLSHSLKRSTRMSVPAYDEINAGFTKLDLDKHQAAIK